MMKRLTTDDKKPIWVNLSLVLTMEKQNTPDHMPGTELVLVGGGSVRVFETPETLVSLANQT